MERIEDHGGPAEPGSPLWEQRRRDMLAEVDKHVEDGIGWALMGVVDQEAGYAWVYTIGLHRKGLPELLMTSADPERAGGLLNVLAQGLIDGEHGPLDDGVEFGPPDAPLRVVTVPADRTASEDWFNGWYAHAGVWTDGPERLLRPKLWVLQIVWSGHDVKAVQAGVEDPPLLWPTKEEPWKDQPIFGEVWW